jgi:hypothetical protein
MSRCPPPVLRDRREGTCPGADPRLAAFDYIEAVHNRRRRQFPPWDTPALPSSGGPYQRTDRGLTAERPRKRGNCSTPQVRMEEPAAVYGSGNTSDLMITGTTFEGSSTSPKSK